MPVAPAAVPGIGITIEPPVVGTVLAGTVLAIAVTVRNIGDVPLSGITGVSCGTNTLAPGDAMGCFDAHTITQAELDAHGFDMLSRVSAIWTDVRVFDAAMAHVPLVSSPAFSVSLQADRPSFVDAGSVIRYQTAVTNTGNQTGVPDAVTLPGVDLLCSPPGAIGPGSSVLCTGTLVVTSLQDVVRTATVTWTTGSADSNPVLVVWIAKRNFVVSMVADRATFDTVGAVITFTVSVTNTGDVLDTPDVSNFPGLSTDLMPPLAPGETGVYVMHLTTTSAADVTATATVGWGTGTARSAPVTVTWVPAAGLASPSSDPVTGRSGLADTGLGEGWVAMWGSLLIAVGVLMLRRAGSRLR